MATSASAGAGNNSSADACYMLIHPRMDVETPNLQTIKRDLERGTDQIKSEALQQVITGTLQGENYDMLLMHIIRFVMPTRNKALKKILLFYWEVCPKYASDGTLKQETILICNALRNDLQHPNEYIRGATLRLLCKLREADLLEPLIGPTRSCLEHRHAYVRKNAVLAVGSIYRHLPQLIPDAPALVKTFLDTEADMVCRRNALDVLSANAPLVAVQWLKENARLVSSLDALLQLSVVDLIRRTSREFSGEKALFIRCVFELLNAPGSAVNYEAAATLVTLTANPVAVKAAASCYISLASKESDNNIKIIVLERLDQLRGRHEGIVDDLVMDLLRVLGTPDLEVRRKALAIVMKLVSRRNIDDVIAVLKKELAKTVENSEQDKASDYRLLLIQTIHSCAGQFPEIAASVVQLFLDSISEFGASSATDAIVFIREVAETYPDLRTSIIQHLVASFLDLKTGKVVRGALWILGEYAESAEEVRAVWTKLREAIGELPLLAAEQRELEAERAADAAESSGDPAPSATSSSHAATAAAASRRILADGTYATESSLTSRAADAHSAAAKQMDSKPPLRAVLLNSDFFTGTVLASTLVKLVLRFAQTAKDDADAQQQLNSLRAEAMLIMAGVIRIGQSAFVTTPIDDDSYSRVLACIRALEHVDEDSAVLGDAFIRDTQDAFARLVRGEEKRAQDEAKKSSKEGAVQVDDGIAFGALQPAEKTATAADAAALERDIEMAMGDADGQATGAVSKLDSVVQLTGFSDAVYAEAYVSVNQYDILLDIMVVNQTSHTLRNLSVEFSTLGDLKLVEKPTTYNVAPFSFSSVKAGIKVSSTETGVIFGTIVYDGPGVSDNHCVVLNEIHVDIMEYIRPARCDETQFHAMWTEFEWENKVNMAPMREASAALDLRSYLAHIMKATNMACLTPENALAGDCGFLSANLYARSIFGEDALANVSIEKPADSAPITGHIRIRAKTQGIALSLGDKISAAKVLLAE
ncbi:coatomer subunit beta [Coemansia sp. RSA 1200]|nr:coatomer subunit beta [Coemansia sp. RSA 1200]